MAAVSFSGAPEIISGLLDDDAAYVSMQDDDDSAEKESSSNSTSKEKEEKEGVKESLITEHLFFVHLHAGTSLEIRNGILRDSGHYPEGHYPPPECA